MKTVAATILASLLAVASAAPAANDNAGCAAVRAASTLVCTTITTTISASAAQATGAAATGAVATGATASGTNVQKFTGSLGGPPPPVISGTGDRPFSVDGDTFVGASAALGRSCDVQHNACANAANSGQLSGGVSQCDQQDTACHSANNLKRRSGRAMRPRTPKRAALDLGSCSNANILFESGLDGRNTEAFVAANQQDFNHGSALNIAVIAGFICQRLGSPCNAPADAQASCTQASQAAVATTQNQAAADAWNAIMGDGSVGGGGGGAAAAATGAGTAGAAAITPAPSSAAAAAAAAAATACTVTLTVTA